MALTATATPIVQKDIITQLALRSPFILKTTFNRPNLTYCEFFVFDVAVDFLSVVCGLCKLACGMLVARGAPRSTVRGWPEWSR